MIKRGMKCYDHRGSEGGGGEDEEGERMRRGRG